MFEFRDTECRLARTPTAARPFLLFFSLAYFRFNVKAGLSLLGRRIGWIVINCTTVFLCVCVCVCCDLGGRQKAKRQVV